MACWRKQGLTELEKYIPKNLTTRSSPAIPLSLDKIKETSRLTKKIEDLEEEITQLQARLDKLSDTEAIINYLETFKDQFTFYCVNEGHDVTILRCANILSMGVCSMKTVCKGRQELGKKLQFINYL